MIHLKKVELILYVDVAVDVTKSMVLRRFLRHAESALAPRRKWCFQNLLVFTHDLCRTNMIFMVFVGVPNRRVRYYYYYYYHCYYYCYNYCYYYDYYQYYYY